MPARRSFWTLGAGEARTLLAIVAVVLWGFAAVAFATGEGVRSATGRLKAADFLQFYTAGSMVRTGDASRLYEADAFRARQVALVPASQRERYLPVYPPQAAMAFAPASLLPFGTAAAVWTLLTIGIYAWVIRAAWRPMRDALPDARLVALAALAFPPFWSLVLHGQNTAVPLAVFFLAWRALERDRPYLSGLILGLLALKPQFGLALAVVAVAGREWRLLGGVLTCGLLQVAVVAAVLEPSVIADYATFMRGLSAAEHLIEPKPHEMHSIRAVTRLLAGWPGTLLWLAAGAAVLLLTARVWTSRAPLRVRFGLLVVATVLVSPHLFVYDATVLALPLLWIGSWIERDPAARRDLGGWFRALALWLGLALLFPAALLTRVQPSVLLMAWMLVGVARHVLAAAPVADADPGSALANA